MVLCDGMVCDPITQKLTLVGITMELRIPALPAIYPGVFVHALVTNLRGTYTPAVVVTLERSGQVLFRQSPEKQIITCDDPGAQIGVSGMYKPFNIRQAGLYRFTLTMNDIPIAHRFLKVLTLVKRPAPPEADPPPPQPQA